MVEFEEDSSIIVNKKINRFRDLDGESLGI